MANISLSGANQNSFQTLSSADFFQWDTKWKAVAISFIGAAGLFFLGALFVNKMKHLIELLEPESKRENLAYRITLLVLATLLLLPLFVTVTKETMMSLFFAGVVCIPPVIAGFVYPRKT